MLLHCCLYFWEDGDDMGKCDEAKDFLKRLKKLDVLIENKLIEKEQWKAIAMNVTSGKHDSEKVQSTGNPQKMADAVIKCMEIEEEIDQYIDRLVDAKREVISVIEQLNPIQYDVLHKVYVQYKSFYDVSNDYDKSKSWVTTVHGRALKNVQNILDERKIPKDEQHG